MRITEELLRKRAEHNEGMLSNLEEIALHQYEIEKIENLDKLCRHIQILLLQNNIIEKMENLSKLKELTYLNLALNNIKKIENLEGCETLAKLDLTCNFIDLEDLEESCYNLQKVPNIKELYLTGNPCQDWQHWREFVIAIVDQLKYIDGKEVLPSERITAKQKLDDMTIDLRTAIEMKKIKSETESKDGQSAYAYTRENRKQMYKEQEAERLEKEKKENPDKFKEKKVSPTHYPNGEPRQCNEGKFEFLLQEWDDPENTLFEIKLPKFLDTSLIDLNLYPKLISIRVKDKLTQLRLQEEILVEKSVIQRSTTTGYLNIKMPKVNPNEVLVSLKRKKETEEREKLKKEKEDKKRQEEETKKNDEVIKKSDGKTYVKKTEIDYGLDDIPDLE